MLFLKSCPKRTICHYNCRFIIFSLFVFKQSNTPISFQHTEKLSFSSTVCDVCAYIFLAGKNKTLLSFLSSTTIIISFQNAEGVFIGTRTQDSILTLVSSPKQIMLVLSVFYCHWFSRYTVLVLLHWTRTQVNFQGSIFVFVIVLPKQTTLVLALFFSRT